MTKECRSSNDELFAGPLKAFSWARRVLLEVKLARLSFVIFDDRKLGLHHCFVIWTSSFLSHSCFDIRHYSLVIVSSRFKIKLATAA